MAGLVIKPRSQILHGHDWVYASEVLKAFGDPQDGDVVSLKDGKDRLLGSAIYNKRSQIVARRFSRQRQELDLDFFTRRIRQAVEYRERRGVRSDLCRIVWSESDGLPGIIVDRYGPTLVLQTLTLAMDQRKSLIVEALVAVLGASGVAGIVESNESGSRKAEGLELQSGLLWGEKPQPTEFKIGNVSFEIDAGAGHKTGFYLDQVNNYEKVAAVAAGRRVLDCFSSQGGFALACAKAGAAEVLAVEVSADLVNKIEANARRNDVKVKAVEANVFDFLSSQTRSGATYDLIVLDPPSFAKGKGKLDDALRGYKEIHLRALQLLAPDGLIVTFSCSHHMSANLLNEVIVDASNDAKRSVRQIDSYSQGLDHPILPHLPETHYLHGVLLEAMRGR
ncbi:MAG TPA: class I SAM-dependent rRNA methyltransferase [Chthoniobacterales bacterium]|jgi:23S rRNA (cytosine1962-C5)-methyltransferase